MTPTTEQIKAAIESLRLMKCEHNHIRKNDAEWEAIETAIACMEKQVPKAVVVTEKKFIPLYLCGTCNCVLGWGDVDNTTCCEHCGQLLDWESEETE